MIMHQAWVGIQGEFCWFTRFFMKLESAQAWLAERKRESQRSFPHIEYMIIERNLIED